jgi:valyl-tRNA synthetase
MDEEMMGVDTVETAESAANSQIETSESNDNVVQTEVATPENKQEVAFAKRLAAEKAKIEAELEGRYNPYKSVLQEAAESYGYSSVDEYLEAYNQAKQQRALEEQAQQMNASPEVLKELNELKQKIAAQEEEKTKAAQEQERKQWESQVKGQVNEVLELAKKDGVEMTEEQLVKAMMDEGISDPRKVYKLLKPEVDLEKVKKSAVEEYFANLKRGNKPVEGGGSSPVIVNSSPKTFAEAREGAKGMIKAFFNNN